MNNSNKNKTQNPLSSLRKRFAKSEQDTEEAYWSLVEAVAAGRNAKVDDIEKALAATGRSLEDVEQHVGLAKAVVELRTDAEADGVADLPAAIANANGARAMVADVKAESAKTQHELKMKEATANQFLRIAEASLQRARNVAEKLDRAQFALDLARGIVKDRGPVSEEPRCVTANLQRFGQRWDSALYDHVELGDGRTGWRCKKTGKLVDESSPK